MNNRATNGFYSISVKGNYIYAMWDQELGTSANKDYIYRFNKKTGNGKRLVAGSNPVIIGKYIYYIQKKIQNDYGEYHSRNTGYIYRMKLNGTAKKKVAYVGTSLNGLYQYGRQCLYSIYGDNTALYTKNGNKILRTDISVNQASTYENMTVQTKQYEFYATKSNTGYTKLYRKHMKTGKVNQIAVFNKGIISYNVCGDYVLIKACDSTEKYVVYCYSVNGKTKKKLASWTPAE